MPAAPQALSDKLRREIERALEQEDLSKAERLLGKALKKNAKDHLSLALTAELYLRQKNLREAFTFYVRAVNAAPHIEGYKKRFLTLASLDLVFDYSEALAGAVVACLRTPNMASRLENWSRLLMAEPQFNAAYGLAGRRPFDASNKSFFDQITDFKPLLKPLFLEGIRHNIVCEPVFEEFVTSLRRHLFLDRTGNSRFTPEQFIVLSAAISHYAFLTDFVLDVSEEAAREIEGLRIRVEEGKDAASSAAVAMLACYRPLHTLSNAREIPASLKASKHLADVVRVQIAEPLLLQERAKSIPAISEIDEGMSSRIQHLYETVPYPRWTGIFTEAVMQDWELDECTRRVEEPLRGTGAKILIAGCGSGREAAMLSAVFPDAIITAVDLSRTSLAYAATKAEEHGIHNIAFRQGDILKLGALGRKFDYISSAGVLHHMQNPIEGWKVLCALLKPGALMRIGLYSEIGRGAVVKAREAIARGGYAATAEDVLRFRRDSTTICDHETLTALAGLKDYYNLNMYRDFLFHFQEHRFNLPEIKRIALELGLSFEGFNVGRDTLTRYRERFPRDPMGLDIDNWHQFEQANPQTFTGGYIFWCRKITA